MQEKQKEFYVTINGQKIVVSEEVYRAYVRPIRREQKRIRRNWRCKIKKDIKGKAKYIRCTKDCSICEYALDGNSANGNELSLEQLYENGVEIVDTSIDIEEVVIKEESAQALRNAISRLNKRQQELINLVYYEGKNQLEVAKRYDVTKKAVNNALARIYATLKRILEKN